MRDKMEKRLGPQLTTQAQQRSRQLQKEIADRKAKAEK